MTSRKTEFFVGLFFLIAIAATVMLALNVANQEFSSDQDTYTLYAKFDNIGGLKVRSSVKVGGVTIGRVSNITLDKNDFIPVVELEILSSYNNFPESTSVAIQTSGLLGEQYLGMQPGFSFGEEIYLQHGDFIQDTKSALVLEDLIGQFLFNRSEN